MKQKWIITIKRGKTIKETWLLVNNDKDIDFWRWNLTCLNGWTILSERLVNVK